MGLRSGACGVAVIKKRRIPRKVSIKFDAVLYSTARYVPRRGLHLVFHV